MKNTLIINYYQQQIENYIKDSFSGDFIGFTTQNPDLNTFLAHSGISTIASHQLTITENDYRLIITNLEQKFITEKQNENKQTQSKPKIKTKTKPKISGFVDGLIIAFITGAFIGIILLNVYSKIAEHI